LDIIFDFLKDKIIGGAGDAITYMTQASINLLDNQIVVNVLNLFEYMGWILLTVGILFAIANVYICYIENGTIDIHLLIINIVRSFIAIFFLKAGAVRLFELSNTINGLISKITSTPNYKENMTSFADILGKIQLNILWVLFIGLIAIIGIVVCLVQIMKRAGMYIAQIMIGYLYLFSMPAGNVQDFIDWCRQTVAIAVTNILQTALLFTGMSIIASSGKSIFLGIGVILAATKVEDLAGRYGMGTGISYRGLRNSFGGFGAFGGTHGGSYAGGSSSGFAGNPGKDLIA
jgi:hypothetical protein